MQAGVTLVMSPRAPCCPVCGPVQECARRPHRAPSPPPARRHLLAATREWHRLALGEFPADRDQRAEIGFATQIGLLLEERVAEGLRQARDRQTLGEESVWPQGTVALGGYNIVKAVIEQLNGGDVERRPLTGRGLPL